MEKTALNASQSGRTAENAMKTALHRAYISQNDNACLWL